MRQNFHLIPEIPLSAKKPWISDATLSLITSFQSQPFEDLSQLKAARKAIKKSARRDKKLFIAQHLEKDFHGSNIHQWDQIRSIRSDFRPKAASLFNLRDKLVSTASRADTFAEYLATKVWFSETDPTIPLSNPHPQVSMDAPFTMHELTLALHRLKSSKAAGPDGIVGELYKHAPYILRMYLLDHYNQCLASATVPTDWLSSEVVMIVKNYSKDARLLANYRPISRTNISYKIFASMIQSRLSHLLDDRIRPTQFGFRKNRSTTQPVHILRRLLEIHERQPSPFHALFLDWSKAFDSVTFTAIHSALEFMGCSSHMVRVIMALYARPSFRVRDAGHTSPIKIQTKGLRQGCPLSPYLFSMILTHLFHDVETQYETQFGLLSGVIHTPSPLWDLEYADDTVLLSNSGDQLTRILHLIQFYGSRRGLYLNEEKCQHLRLHSDHRVYYAPGSADSPCSCATCTGQQRTGDPVPLFLEVKYLGVFLDSTGTSHKNVSFRITQAIHSSKLLKPLLSHSSLPPSWKLTVYRSIVQSILMYAMDSAFLSPPQLTRLNAVHFKCLRRVFKIKSSYYHRVLSPSDAECSNEYLSGLAFSSKRVLSPSQIYSHDRLRLLGHILKHTDSIEYSVTFMPSGAYRFIQGPNRVGRPRLHWSESCMTEASNRIDFLASDSAPHHTDIHNEYFRIPSSREVLSVHSTHSVVWMDNTLLYRKVRANALNRTAWNKLFHKPTKNYST